MSSPKKECPSQGQSAPNVSFFSRLEIVIHETLEILCAALSQILSHSLVRPFSALGILTPALSMSNP